ncbi:hypothetical protein GQ54DRAFT_306010 [Martensiomyces pterosporus]|nr:hypothetical protein GQ54DRAFT_306010 [Martensiomyces pterosporus]
MCSFQDLPSRVIENIVDYFCQHDAQIPNAGHIKRLLEIGQLCNTCTAIRSYAQPYYNEVVVFERHECGAGREPDTAVNPKLIWSWDEPPYIWRTNAISIVLSKRQSGVRIMIINSRDAFIEPMDMIDALNGGRFGAFEWPNIQMLRMYQGYDDTGEETTKWVTEESLTKLGEFLAKSLPALTELDSYDTLGGRLDTNHTMSTLMQRNITRMTKIQALNGNNPVFGVRQLPQQITHLDLQQARSGEALMLPKIFAPSLKFLGLQDIPLSYIWDQFYGGQHDDSGDLYFDSLVALKVAFFMPIAPMTDSKGSGEVGRAQRAQQADDVDSVYTVLKANRRRPRFPKLRKLEIAKYPGGKLADFLEDFPVGRIVELRVDGVLASFKSLSLRAFKALQQLSVTCTTQAKTPEHPHVNRLLAKTFGMEAQLHRLYIKTDWRLKIPMPPRIKCVSLKFLSLDVKMDIPTIAKLLDQLPRLEYLRLMQVPRVHVWPLVWEDMLKEALKVVRTPEDIARGSNLLELDVEGLFSICDASLVIPVILLLSMRIPSLQHILLDGNKEASALMIKLIRELSAGIKKYSNLSAVDVSVG